jgi:GntR family transcriptional regulator, transcriptional repressor for pyruvate dehydrogenase complex
MNQPIAVARVRPAYIQVSDQLRDLIIKGGLAPGERLPVETELSVMFGVSRSTVREALRTLSSQNLVTTRRGVNGGTFVAEPDADNLGAFLETSIGLLTGTAGISVAELLEARSLFEVPAASLAATRRTAEQLEFLRQSLAGAGQSGLSHNFEGHKEFHRLIMEVSGNRLLEVITRPIFSVLRTRFLRDQAPREFWVCVVDDHQKIFDAIEASDAESAGSLMQEHLDRLRVTYETIDVAPTVHHHH